MVTVSLHTKLSQHSLRPQSQFIEMFGDIEDSWPLKDVIEASFPGEWGSEDKNGTGVKVIRTTNFTNEGKLNLADVVTRDIPQAKIDKKHLIKGDIILERSGGTNENPVGRVVYFNEEGIYLFNNFTQLLRCKQDVNWRFVFYSLYAYYQSNKTAIRSMGNKTTGIQNLKMEQYWQIPIKAAPRALQDQFASLFEQADKSKFDGFKSQFIEMLSQGTKWRQLSSVASSMSKGIVPKYVEKSNIVIVNQACVHWDNFNLNKVKYHNPNVVTTKSELEDYDVLLNMTGNGTLGRSCLFFKPNDNNIYFADGHVLVIKTDKDYILPEVLVKYFSLPDIQAELYRNYVTGSTNQLDIVLSEIRKMSIPTPTINLQIEFVSIARQADKSKYYIQKLIS